MNQNYIDYRRNWTLILPWGDKNCSKSCQLHSLVDCSLPCIHDVYVIKIQKQRTVSLNKNCVKCKRTCKIKKRSRSILIEKYKLGRNIQFTDHQDQNTGTGHFWTFCKSKLTPARDGKGPMWSLFWLFMDKAWAKECVWSIAHFLMLHRDVPAQVAYSNASLPRHAIPSKSTMFPCSKLKVWSLFLGLKTIWPCHKNP